MGNTKADISEFLRSRRARLSPEQAGLPTYGARRVPGLRREEVAVLAGVSAPYYTRLERGNVAGASDSVLESLARALQLDEAERAHLFDLARAASPLPQRRAPRPVKVVARPAVQYLLESLQLPALLRNERLDLLAGNQLGLALYAPMFVDPVRPANTARFTFLDPAAHDFYRDWCKAADDVVAVLRSLAGRTPCDRGLHDLVGELSTRSDEFRRRWATHNVRFHLSGDKRFHHPVVGDLELRYERLDIASEPGLTIFVYLAEPGSRSAEALALLGSWSATEAAAAATPGGSVAITPDSTARI